MNRAYRGLQGLLWFISASHVVLGGAIILSEQLQRYVADLYGVSVELEPQLCYILRPLGAFMVALGVIAGAAALRPLRHRTIIWALAGLFVVRVLQRIVFREEIGELFGISNAKLITASVFFGILAILLIVLLQLAARTEPHTTSSTEHTIGT